MPRPQNRTESPSIVTQPNLAVYRFARFELRTHEGTLLRDGQRVRLEDLPMRMLAIVVDRAGQLVLREEMRELLWGAKAFGDFDNGLNVAARKLREALSESPSSPSLLETVRGKGYRFTAEVVRVPGLPAYGSQETAPLKSDGHAIDSPWSDAMARFRGIKRGWYGLTFAVVVAFTLACFPVYKYLHRPLLDARGKVTLGSFANMTGDHAFDGILFSALQTKLEESPYLSLIPARKLQHLLKDSQTTALGDQIQACLSLNGSILLRGQISARQSGYEVQLTAWRCADKRSLATVTSSADSKKNVLAALGTASVLMRRRLGEPPGSLDKFNMPLEQATTTSLAALHAFTVGEQKRAAGQEAESIADYKLAVDLDPQFAVAYARLGTIYSNLGEDGLSSQYYQKAFPLRQHTTDWERLYITSHYYGSATGQIQDAIEADQIWHTVYPRDASPVINLAVKYLNLGEVTKAVDLARTAIELGPDASFAQGLLAEAYLRSGDLKELATLCHEADNVASSQLPFQDACYLLAFENNDAEGLRLQLQHAHGSPAESQLIEESAWVAAYRGQLHESRRLFAEARADASANHLPEWEAKIYADEADLLADLGFAAEARRQALLGLKLAPEDMDVESYAALALARSGDTSAAQIEMREAATQFPLDTLLNSAKLPPVQAAIDMRLNNPGAAVDLLQSAKQYDFYAPMALALPYYRGLANLQKTHPQTAAAEFQRVIDHRALSPNSPYVPLSEFELGRSLQLAGDQMRAAQAYQAAGEIWKDADADFPPLVKLHEYQQSLSGARLH